MKACRENRVYEAFGAGTAAVVSPVQSFIYDDETYQIPIDEAKGAGKLTERLLNTITDLHYGKAKRPEWQTEVCQL